MFRLLFWPVLAPSFLFTAGLGAILPIQILAAIDLGIPPAAAALLVAAAGAVSLLCTIPVGSAIDRLGDKRSMSLATISAAFALVLTVLALVWVGPWSVPLYVAGLLLRAPASIAFSLARQSVVAETLPAPQRGKAMTALGGAQRAGLLAGPLLGSLVLLWLPMWAVFLLAICLIVLATGLLYLRRFNAAFDTATSRARARRAEAGAPPLRVRWGAVFFAGISVGILSLARVSQPLLVALWGLHLGWSEAQISLAIALGSALEMVLMFPGGYLKDRVGRSFILGLCLFLFGTGYLLTPFWQTSWGFILALALMSVGNGFGAGINMTIGADLSPETGRAKFLSIWSIFTQAATVAGPLAISAVLAVSALPAVFTLVGAVTAAGAFWAVAVQPVTKLPRRQRS